MGDADLSVQRDRMLHEHLWRRGIRDRRVLAAMGRISRERFVDPQQQDQAYTDQALAIGCGQTISQPYVVALMSQALELTGRERVLEIGTGSGYQTAVLAELADGVVSVERHRKLSAAVGALLAELGYRNVALHVGDGSLGWPDAAPFDRVIVTAAAAQCPPSLFDQLREGGTLVIPVGHRDQQVLQSIRKIGGVPQQANLSPCRFVPLMGVEGWPE